MSVNTSRIDEEQKEVLKRIRSSGCLSTFWSIKSKYR